MSPHIIEHQPQRRERRQRRVLLRLRHAITIATLAATTTPLGCAPGRGGMLPTTVTFPTAAPFAMPPSQPAPGAPRVHLAIPPDSSLPQLALHELRGFRLNPVSVQGPGGGTQHWTAESIGRPLCEPPCGRIVDGRDDQEFYFGGPGISDSRRFKLANEAGDLFFTVRPGQAGVERGGMTLTGLGAGGVIVSGVVLLLAPAMDAGPRTYRDSGIALGVSSAVLSAGIALLLNGRTTFTVRREPAPSLPRDP